MVVLSANAQDARLKGHTKGQEEQGGLIPVVK